MAGDHCDIYDSIDRLGEARTVQELTARLKPILLELAYYAKTGDGAIMEAQEKWHDIFTDRLYDAVRQEGGAPGGAPRAVDARPGVPGPQAPVQARGVKQDNGARTGPATRIGGPGARPHPATEGRPPAALSRPPPGVIPPSLLSIMHGTHHSLHEPESQYF